MGRRQKKAAQQRKREAVEQQRKRKAEELAARENAAIAEAVRELESYLEGQNIRIEFGDELSEAHLKMLLGLDLKALAQALRAADAAAATTAADELLRQLRSRMLSEQEHVQQREAQRAAHACLPVRQRPAHRADSSRRARAQRDRRRGQRAVADPLVRRTSGERHERRQRGPLPRQRGLRPRLHRQMGQLPRPHRGQLA